MSAPRRTRAPLVLLLGLAAACVDDDGTAPPRQVPDAVAHSSATSPDSIRTIAAGWRHACALDVSGAAWCWGANDLGQLGRASTEWCADGEDSIPCSSRPIPVRGARSYSHLAAGGYHSCGVEAGTGHIYCWGSNYDAQLGNAAYTFSTTPVRVNGPGSFRTVTAGWRHSCALASDARVWCWGANYTGQSAGPDIVYYSPRVVGDRPYRMVSAGFGHTCALGENTFVYCWGDNTFGQVGDTAAPVLVRSQRRVNGGDGYSWVAGGGFQSCALRGAGRRVWCWGSDWTTPPPWGATPRSIPAARSFEESGAGAQFGCALEATSRRITCWGVNGDGQLGRGDSSYADVQPARVVGNRTYQSLAVGWEFACATDGDGHVFCWGDATYGQVGREPGSVETCGGEPCSVRPRPIRTNVVFAD